MSENIKEEKESSTPFLVTATAGSTASSKANRTTLPCWRPRNVLARMNRARHFPEGTDPASRHAALIATELIRRGEYPMLLEEPEHCGISIAVTVELLWKARAEIAALGSRLSTPKEVAGAVL